MAVESYPSRGGGALGLIPLGPEGDESLSQGSGEGTRTIQMSKPSSSLHSEANPAMDYNELCGTTTEREKQFPPPKIMLIPRGTLQKLPLPLALSFPMPTLPIPKGATSLPLSMLGNKRDWGNWAVLCTASVPT